MLLKIALNIVLLFGLICSTLENCRTPPSIANGSVNSVSTELGGKATYNCYPGYIIRGPPYQICGKDGWVGILPVCKPKSCGSPGEIFNGWVEDPSIEFGSKVIFHCDKGFRLIGRNYRLCESHGWSGIVPTCESVRCANLDPIDKGRNPVPPGSDYWEYGMLAEYSCDDDYALIGANVIECTASGNWSHVPPTCKIVKCMLPRQPKNSEILSGFGSIFKYKESIVYQCKHGFGMIGSNVLECGEDSRFEPHPPICKLTGCYQPKLVFHASLVSVKPVYAQWETITYRCYRGYKLIGSETIVCLGNNTFDHEPPSCHKIKCVIDWNFHTGRISPHKYNFEYRDHLTFSCNFGYKLVGHRKSTCQADGTLHPPPPTCQRVFCTIKENFQNGMISPTKRQYAYGELLTFSCNDGYRLLGNNKSRCVDENTLEPPPPICKKELPDQMLLIQNLMMDIIPLSRNIIQEKNRSMQLEYQQLKIEENILSEYEEILKKIELFMNKTISVSPS